MSLTVLMTAAAQAAAPSGAGARQAHEVLMPSRPEYVQDFERYGFSEAVIDGNRVYLSGVVAGLVGNKADESAAYDRAFRIIGSILKRSGSSWDGVRRYDHLPHRPAEPD